MHHFVDAILGEIRLLNGDICEENADFNTATACTRAIGSLCNVLKKIHGDLTPDQRAQLSGALSAILNVQPREPIPGTPDLPYPLIENLIRELCPPVAS